MPRPSAPCAPADILVIKLGALGDFFLAQTAFRAIRRHHAGDRLTLLTIPSLAPLAERSGLFDAVWSDPRGRTPAAYLAMRRRLRAGRFARVYDLQCQSRTDRYFLLHVPGPWPEWSGTARGCSHPDRYPGRRKVPVIERYARQLRPFGITLDPWPDLSWLDADTGGFGLDGPYALLVPGSSPGRPDKRWPVDRYAELAQRLAERGIRPVVLGTAIETDLAAAITAACPATLDLTQRTGIAEIAGLAHRAVAAVGNDTGPTHLIAATGAPTVVLFSDASDPIHALGRRTVVHHVPDFADMDTAGVLAAVERARTL
ncbi:glycosyltransferase family 9 protein [Azospirillum halopraeferens]|uniref:glycosyltransferase family 9 protein n=1 Tax=Azospirillum halopraeferens TaxID=34010 RepID=UPI0004124851|nr:glycosyltransferase family 9 protein [Azospirillum halopraeferens]